MSDYTKNSLHKMMHPKSIALWGASNNPMGMGSVQLTQIIDGGYEGRIFPMHPTESNVKGLTAYAKVSDLPSVPDLGILILPTKVVPEILEECGQSGVTHVIIVSAGFGEAGEEGKLLQDKILTIADRYGIRFLGPNCIGIVNTQLKLNTTFFPYDAGPGFIGMASQSGSFITQMFVHLKQFGLGFSQGFSVGNEAMTDITDCMEYLSLCPDTKVIGLYVEGIRNGRKFFDTARRVSEKKPIVAYYIGGSESGKRAGNSHTGALAGPDQLYEGLFKQCGIIRAYSIEELFDFCYVLGTQPLPLSNQTAILTHSGGPGAAAADTAERSGLKLVDFSPITIEALTPLVPHTASLANPVDLTFSKNPSDYTETIPKILLRDEHVHNLFMYMLMPVQRVVETIRNSGVPLDQAKLLAHEYIKTQCEIVAGLSREFKKPVVGGSFYSRDEQFIRNLQDLGAAVLPSPERAMKALAALVRYAEGRDRLLRMSE